MTALAKYFRVRRRYARSVNLERDLELPDALEGYVLTPRAVETATRIAAAASKTGAARAWTLTGVYGTGKSSFAHFLAALHAPAGDPTRDVALRIAEAAGEQALAERYRSAVPKAGYVRAVVTGRREPLAHAVIRALASGAERFWVGRVGPRPGVLKRLRVMMETVETGGTVDARGLPELVQEIGAAARTGVLLVLDELGKVFEATARADGSDDLYLLQQLAELPSGPEDPPVLVVGLLHQAFAEYADGLAGARRTEWEKVHGRFEDIPFAEAPAQMLRLMGEAIEADPPADLAERVAAEARAWQGRLQREAPDAGLGDPDWAARFAALFPLHPVAAAVLPQLCARYAQNERSLFTFLASPEPYSLTRFLADRRVDEDPLPLLLVADLYDYFVDVAGMGLYSRPQFQRWAEVHALVREAAGQDQDELRLLKTIGTLNLLGSTGALRAGRHLVLAAVAEAADGADAARWAATLDRLLARGTIAYRERVDELRIWEGSHHDIGQLVRQRTEADRRTISELLTYAAPLPPVVAQRESYRTGALRYFERQYAETPGALGAADVQNPETDGVLVHWVGADLPLSVPTKTASGRPLAVVPARSVRSMEAAVREFVALAELDRGRGTLQTDGVARREIRQRFALARRAVDESVRAAFTPGAEHPYWVLGERRADEALNAALSEACRALYPDAPVVWNELVNRRDLTPQGSRARRVLIDAMLTAGDRPSLGLAGNGPEVTMYHSVLGRTGIHRERETGWDFGPPSEDAVSALWLAVEGFCDSASETPRPVSELYALLQAPPYGVKAGMIPVVLAAVLLYRADDVSVYRNGTFLPILGSEHFEVLVKNPREFSVKHFRIEGLRLEVFQELKSVLAPTGKRLPREIRNATVLGVARPLTNFARRLPAVTAQTRRVSEEARAVRTALLSVTEPERLLFEDLPKALGFAPFSAEPAQEPGGHESFRRALLAAIRELHRHYERLLEDSLQRIQAAFKAEGTVAQTREDLRVRARALYGRIIEPRLHALVHALVDGDSEDKQWIESVLMVIADRPADTWTDDDALAFELNLTDLAYRFRTLFALQEDLSLSHREGFDARRVVITHPNGLAVRETVWVGREHEQLVNDKLDELEGVLGVVSSEMLRTAIAVRFAERLIGGTAMPEAAETPDAARGDDLRRQHG